MFSCDCLNVHMYIFMCWAFDGVEEIVFIYTMSKWCHVELPPFITVLLD